MSPVPEHTRKGDQLIELILEKLEALDTKLENHMREEDNKIGELVDAWNASKHIVTFVKWTAAIVTSVALGWAWITDHFTVGVK